MNTHNEERRLGKEAALTTLKQPGHSQAMDRPIFSQVHKGLGQFIEENRREQVARHIAGRHSLRLSIAKLLVDAIGLGGAT